MLTFTGTLPTFMCKQAFSDCISGAQGNSMAQQGCHDDIGSQCGTMEPEDQQSSSETPSPTSSLSRIISPSSSVLSSASASLSIDTETSEPAEIPTGSTTDGEGEGVDTGAKAGFGVGVGPGGVLVIGMLACLLYCLRKAKKDRPPVRFEKPELADTQWYGHQKLETPVETKELVIEKDPV